MRIGEVIGTVTLSVSDPKIVGKQLTIVQPHNPRSLRENGTGTDEVVVCIDELNCRLGDRVGFSEGREAAMPWHPVKVAVDAYVGCLLDDVTYET
ncbi:MAG TPA: EutN/CcmL family microcompartment protein [Phycisphaerae bacterium]|nr:EutN/CcmL family microcompartment protein [Phycisphaerae bacterium]HOJ72860.1 EutN/CcmL family microcompartment protein [Phycisphaerae bacterium]HOM51713.1 EutN/CcmL family microcompartment protein [Phycisphaerae bacterium]HOQ87996.1 EutN/CcmL family microcompartment protein [Phycisphaerae bacterium]HPP28780.1 EutN/CcmL family microcompartment protein [Phycisphaerae bacterium]